MLYFFHCHVATVISHGITKKTAKVPPIEIKRAIDRKRKFEQNPQQHTQEMTERKPITDAVEILQRLYFEKDSEMMDWLEAERIKGNIAQRAYDLREEAELTQKQLAKKVGTTSAIIDDLEMTDYEDHQLGNAVLMLKRIAKAVGKQIFVDFQVVSQEADVQ